MFGRRIVPSFPRIRYLINPSLLSSRKLFTTSFNLHTKGLGPNSEPPILIEGRTSILNIIDFWSTVFLSPIKDCSHNNDVKPKIETTHYQLVFTCTAKLGENHETTCNHRSTHQDWFTVLYYRIAKNYEVHAIPW